MAVRTRGAVDAGIPARPTAATASPCLGAKAKGQAQRAHSCAGLAGLLAEFRRVVRPGGLVALKEFDTALVRLAPAPVTLFWHYWEVAALHTPQIRGCLRGPKLRTALRQAEFANTTLRIILFASS